MNPLQRSTASRIVSTSLSGWVGRLYRSLHAEVANVMGVPANGLPRLSPEFNQLARVEFEKTLQPPVTSIFSVEIIDKVDKFAKGFALRFAEHPSTFLTPLQDLLVNNTPEECRRLWCAFFARLDKWALRASIKNQRITEVVLPVVIVLMHDREVYEDGGSVDGVAAVRGAMSRLFKVPASGEWQKEVRTVRHMLRTMVKAGDIVALAALDTITERRPHTREHLPQDAQIFQGIVK